ncbi:MAG: hypothetical protein EP338_06580 [Bacteroidetes bacterium]|nr:MAG: hypothetical protein EP338_06580 [Bacteroidota bacterium]
MLCLVLVSAPGFTQNNPEYELCYESSFHQKDLPFQVGDTMILQQSCTNKAAKELLNHSIQFNNYHIGEIRFQLVVFFSDTVVRKLVYHYSGKDVSSALQALQLKEKDFQYIHKGLSFYSSHKNDIRYSCWVDRHKIYYIEEFLKEE